MRRIISAMLCLLLMCTMTACGGKNTVQSETTEGGNSLSADEHENNESVIGDSVDNSKDVPSEVYMTSECYA